MLLVNMVVLLLDVPGDLREGNMVSETEREMKMGAGGGNGRVRSRE
jgi:hypothetical protein